MPVLGCKGRVVMCGEGGLSGDYVVDVQEGRGEAVSILGVEGGRWTATFLCSE